MTRRAFFINVLMNKIADGNTAIGVNQAIINFLLSLGALQVSNLKRALDLPCGEGKFMMGLKATFPNVEILGKDLYAKPIAEAKPYFLQQGVDQWAAHSGQKFDLITCISGVMVFDNLVPFFQQCSSHLNSNGIFIVTNDNVMTLRDRLSWLLWGRMRRFKKFYDLNEGNWNLVLIQALVRFYLLNDFEIKKIEYVSTRWEDWLLAPVALLLYPLQLLTLRKGPAEISWSMRLQMYSWKSLFARHYIIYGVKK